MKKFVYLSLLCSFLFQPLFAAPLSPTENSAIYHHLLEVNKQWENVDLKSINIEGCISFENDLDRIQYHLILVKQLLAQKELPNLTKKQIERRHHHLEKLTAYFSQKRFPVNSNHDARQPYFIDKFGTACAVGYLLLEDGQQEFVQKIVEDNNYAYVMDMNYPALGIWANENGFSKEELALIQPSYPPAPTEVSPVGNNLGVDGKINKLLTSSDGELLYMCGAFDVVDGDDGYNGIAAWDGQEWNPLESGVIGEIMDMDTDANGNLYVVGNFSNPNNSNQTNIAMWNGTSWEWRQEGDMNGTVYTVYAIHPTNIHVGGDFTAINNQPISFVARSEDDAFAWGNKEGDLTLDGPVYEIEVINDKLLFGGDFSQTYPTGTNPDVDNLEVNNLAYWDHWNWVAGFEEEEIGVVSMISHIDGKLFVGGAIDDGSYYSVLEAGFWTHLTMDNSFMDTLGIHNDIAGCIAWEDRILMYGGFRSLPFVGTSSIGLMDVTNTYGPGVAEFVGGSVNASAIYQDELYFAGDFYAIGGGWSSNTVSCNNLMKTTLSPISSVDKIDEHQSIVEVFYANNALNYSYEELNQTSTLILYDLTGRPINEVVLEQGSNTSSIDISGLPKGAYAVSIRNREMNQSDMIVVY